MFDDQAAGLRHLHRNKPVRVIAVTSGKGGVGKTNVTVNLGAALSELGQRVLLLDADFGLANIDVMLGLRPTHNLYHVLKGERALEDILLNGPCGMKVVPAASGVAEMANLSDIEYGGLIRAFSDLGESIDVLLVDTAAGISSGVASICRAAQDVLVVVCDEPASITDAYALIKVMSRDYGLNRFRVLANMVHQASEGRQLFEKLARVAEKFLDVTLDYVGIMPFDESVRKAVQKQKSVVEAFPRSRAALAFKNLAMKADKWPIPAKAAGHLEFFVERLISANGANSEAVV